MKLMTEKGEFPLPSDFSFEIESNNPFFSEEGTASIPVTIPATGDALGLLDHPERMGKSKIHQRTVSAILQHGTYQRRCNMIVESCGNEAGISASLAFSESELYSSIKKKELKTLFKDRYLQTPYKNLSSMMNALYFWSYTCEAPGVYMKDGLDDVRIFPVYVGDVDGEYEDKLNLESNRNFSYIARTITVDDMAVEVPDGYGITVFLLLHRMIAMTFELCGYRVVRNDFSRPPFSSIVVVNNCADMFCKGSAPTYSDMVPSITVEDLITWLKDRFGAVVSVRHDTVSIIMIQNALTAEPDMDLSSMLRDSPVLTYPASSRVVLGCSTDLDSAEPAADTMQKLKEKYSVCRELVRGDDPMGNGLCLYMAEGIYRVILNYSFQDKSYEWKELGTNCFTYDRDNSEDSEEHIAEDRFLPMLYRMSRLAPYIGDRLHYNTSIAGEEEETEQPLQICYAFFHATSSTEGFWFGSTQPYYSTSDKALEYTGEDGLPRTYPPLSPDGLYGLCWERYNRLLLNSAPEIEAQIDFSLEQVISLDMLTPKLLCGQKVMVKSLSYEMSEQGIVCGKCRLQLMPEYRDEVKDEPVEWASPSLIWQRVDTMSKEVFAVVDAMDDVFKTEEIFDDGIQDYGPDDAPGYAPESVGVKAKERDRSVIIRFWMMSPAGYYYAENKGVVYKEYFISVYDNP